MTPIDLPPTLAAMLLAATAFVLCVILLISDLVRPHARRRRIALVLPKNLAGFQRPSGDQAQGNHRRKIDDTLREMIARQKSAHRMANPWDLREKLRQAGLAWTPATYAGVSAGCAAAVFVIVQGLAEGGPLLSSCLALVAAGILPHLYVRRARKKRFTRYLAEFPDALDAITRGVRSGLPVNDCMRDIAENGREPLRTEFNLLLDDMALGLTIDEAMTRMVARTPILEIKFFTIILSIQNKAGGNLAEAIGNLSSVLRDRKRLHSKIKALSSEAVASAAIIGSLPIIVMGVLLIVAPDYSGALFKTTFGRSSLIAGGIWMLLGVIVMRSMIRIDI